MISDVLTKELYDFFLLVERVKSIERMALAQANKTDQKKNL